MQSREKTEIAETCRACKALYTRFLFFFDALRTPSVTMFCVEERFYEGEVNILNPMVKGAGSLAG